VRIIGLALSIAGLGACTGPTVDPNDPVAMSIERGRQIYQTNCTACHNSDPSRPGTVGPEIAGSPRALVEARVMHAQYPPGYSPKRATTLMTPLPQLEGNLDDITAYLGAH
jgi:mono/diheme cytochrome c family protein